MVGKKTVGQKRTPPIMSYDSDMARALSEMDIFQPILTVKDIYSFPDSETSHRLPDKEEAKLYYANRSFAETEEDEVETKTETQTEAKTENGSSFERNTAFETAASNDSGSDSEIEILQDEDSAPKRTSNNNSSSKKKTMSPKKSSKNNSNNNSSSKKKTMSPKKSSNANSKNNSSDENSLFDQFDNLMDNFVNRRTGKSSTETGKMKKEEKKEEIGKKNSQKRKSEESNVNNNSKKSKVSVNNKKGSNNQIVEDIEEVILIDDDDDDDEDREFDDESTSNPGSDTGHEAEDRIVVETDSTPLDEVESKIDDILKLVKKKERKAKELHFSDSQPEEEYDPIEINSNILTKQTRKSNNKMSPKNIRIIEQKSASSFSDDEIVIEDDDEEFRKPVCKVQKVEGQSNYQKVEGQSSYQKVEGQRSKGLRNVQITPRTSKDAAKFAQSKVTSTPIGGTEMSNLKKSKSKKSESSEDEDEVLMVGSNVANDQVILITKKCILLVLDVAKLLSYFYDI